MKERAGYFEVINGCAGDMLAGSLVDAGLPLEDLVKELGRIDLRAYRVEAVKVLKKTGYGHSLEATRFMVIPDTDWDDSTPYSKIIALIEGSRLSEKSKGRVLKVFGILARAESEVHREGLDHLHFHQVGQIDAIVEVASVAIGLEMMGIEKVYCSSVGISKPAPATVNMLKGVPVIMRSVNGEITTPTGIAILKGLCETGTPAGDIMIEKAGYGAGEMDMEHPNVVRFYSCLREMPGETVMVLQANIDDMSPVIFESLFEKLLSAGALDVSVYAGTGKKNRPVFNMQVLLPERLLQKISGILFRETTTIGVRYRVESRIVLDRKEDKVVSRWGEVRIKRAYMDGEVVNAAPEYEDCRKIASTHDISLKQVYAEISKLI